MTGHCQVEQTRKEIGVRFVFDPGDKIFRYRWKKYAVCGSFGSCNVGYSPQRQCMEGFVPKVSKNWDGTEWPDGCVPMPPLNCSTDKGFIKYSNVKLHKKLHIQYNHDP